MSFVNLKTVRQKGFIFNQIHKLTITIYSSQPNIYIQYFLKQRISKMHRQFFKIISQNPD